jgi:hypothetical protein
MSEKRPSGRPTFNSMHRAVLVLVAPLVLLVGGCDDGGAAAEPLTKAQVIKSADAICRDAQARIDALAPLPRSLRDAEPYLQEQAAIAQDQADKARALETPETDRASFDQWTSATQEFVDVTTTMAAAAGEGDQAEFQELAARRNEIVERAGQAARAYGMEVCGGGSEADLATPLT